MLMMRNKSELKNRAKRHAKQKREQVGLEWRANLWPIWPGRIPHGQDLASYPRPNHVHSLHEQEFLLADVRVDFGDHGRGSASHLSHERDLHTSGQGAGDVVVPIGIGDRRAISKANLGPCFTDGTV